jgi:TIR domain-containing protein
MTWNFPISWMRRSMLAALSASFDRHGISGGEDWKRRLGNLISEADTVVFVLTPTSARSEICTWEAEEAGAQKAARNGLQVPK